MKQKEWSEPVNPHAHGYKAQKAKDFIVRTILFICAIFSVITVFFIIYFLFQNAYEVFDYVSLKDFILGDRWNPTAADPKLGAYNLIMGSILVTAGSMIIAIPLSIGCAIYISQYAHPKIKDGLKLTIEILSGIPSVVYGFFGLIVLTKWIRVTWDKPTGETLLAGSIILGIMALPTIITVAEDAISSVGRDINEASLALGATKWQTISKVIVPAALSGITAAIILGIGRAVGETMAVLMVTGNADQLPEPLSDVFTPVKTMTGTLGIEMGEVPYGSEHFHALFALAIVLFLFVLGINLIARYILAKISQKHLGTEKKMILGIKTPPLVKRGFRYVAFSIPLAIFGWLLLSWFGFLSASAVMLGCFAVYFMVKKARVEIQEYVAQGVLIVTVLTVVAALGILLYDIISKGLPIMSWEFISDVPRDLGREGGIYPAIVGTFLLVLGAIAISLPIGVGAGIYLNEYAKEGWIVKIVRAGIDNLNGTPSIVFGLFGFAFFVIYMDFGVSLISGQLTLGLMVLPTIIRTTEEALKSVPMSVREGSLALGSTKWQTIWRVVLPPAFPGVITGTILSIGRAAGETAPIMFVACTFMSRHLPSSMYDRVMALPYMIYIMATEVPGGIERGYGVALVLLILVVIMYGTAAIILNRFRKKVKW